MRRIGPVGRLLLSGGRVAGLLVLPLLVLDGKRARRITPDDLMARRV